MKLKENRENFRGARAEQKMKRPATLLFTVQRFSGDSFS